MMQRGCRSSSDGVERVRLGASVTCRLPTPPEPPASSGPLHHAYAAIYGGLDFQAAMAQEDPRFVKLKASAQVGLWCWVGVCRWCGVAYGLALRCLGRPAQRATPAGRA